MPIPFVSVCELLEEAHQACIARKSPTPAVEAWFARYRTKVDAHDTDLAALLSTLLPEKRTDRVYFIQAPALEKIIGRGLCLRSSRIPELARYRQPGSGVDLAECVESILTTTPNAISRRDRASVEEVDQLLHGLASRIKFSSPVIRASSSTDAPDRNELATVFRRLTSLEAKWFTRLVLKSFAPLVLDDIAIGRLCDPILPSILQVRGDFRDAMNVLQAARDRLLPNERGQITARKQLLAQLKPALGIKVGRQHWMQARSIQHCLSLGSGRMSVEDKLDGEYCQIHVDLTKTSGQIQIFSKSGKDSTEDKEALHSIIRSSLDVGKPTCRFSKSCILEGEVVVYSDHEKRILPFHKIRNHITRRGLFLNTDQDSLPKAGEHLMIVYYDILLLDDDSLLGVRHSERRKVLSSLIKCQLGWAELAKSDIVDFDSRLGASHLRNIFAKTIVNKQEGLVLKVDEPYFDFSIPERPWCGRCIKFKKEYIGGFGDVGDFAVVGAGYDPTKAKKYNLPGLKWTHFFVGCLRNKAEVERWSAMADFTVVNVVELNTTQLRSISHCSNPAAVPVASNDKFLIDIQPGICTRPRMAFVFMQPLVVDLRCFSFDKIGNTGFWSPRFPVVSRVHLERDFMDALTFEELQQKAAQATAVQAQPDSQENLEWIAKLEAADPRGVAVDAVSQLTATTMPTPSPRRSTQSSSQISHNSPVASRALFRSTTAPNISPPAHFADVPGVLPPQIQPQPLITPPTSSDPQPLSPSQTKHRRSQKRSPPSLQQVSQASKRRRSSTDKARSASSPVSRSNSKQRSKRKPLAEVDINSSQRSPNSSQSVISGRGARENMPQKAEVIDLTGEAEESSMTAPFKPATAGGRLGQPHIGGSTTPEAPDDVVDESENFVNGKKQVQQDSNNVPTSTDLVAELSARERQQDGSQQTVDSQDSNYVNLFFPGWDHAVNEEVLSDESLVAAECNTSQLSEERLESQATGVQTPTEEATIHGVQIVSRSGCKYAADKCYFATRDVFLAPHLKDLPEEAIALLRGHGVEDASTDIRTWLKEKHEYISPQIGVRAEYSAVLLVDGVQHSLEVETLCTELREARSEQPEGIRAVVTMYDWRALRHITVHEDDSVMKKYYDGFGNPFRRWYVGLL